MIPLVPVLMVLAADPAPARTADAILDDYAKAVGGEDAFKRHKTMHMKRQVELKGMNMSGTDERYATSAGKSLSIVSLPNIGSFRQGSDGKVRWSEDPINGLRVLAGAEDEEAKVESTWNAELQLKKLYEKVRVVPPPEPPPAGKKYECVELTPKLAQPAITCFDAQTHLRVYQKGTHATPQGEIPYTVKFSDWRDVEGVKMPFSEDTVAGPMNLSATVTEVKFDEKIDPKVFTLPKPGKKPAKPAPLPKPAPSEPPVAKP
jgi:zinc protease